jgi:hypothetical protein
MNQTVTWNATKPSIHKTTNKRKQDIMNWSPMARMWHRVTYGLKSTFGRLYRALAADWLAKISLRDHYADRRHS